MDDRGNDLQPGAKPSMSFWQWLHDLGPGWPDGRGWVGIATTSLTVMVLWMMAERKDLREDDFFQLIATAIILTGFVQGVIGWAYSATKTGGELADSNARIAEQVATTSAITDRREADRPKDVNIVGQDKPVDVEIGHERPETGAGERFQPSPAADSRIPDAPLSEAPAADFEEDAAPRG